MKQYVFGILFSGVLVITPFVSLATNHPAETRGDCYGLCNPLDSSISSIPAFFLAILDILLVFAIPFVVFFIIYAGFLYVTARGNPGTIEQAHKALLYAIIGGLLIFGARAILVIITNTVNSVVLQSVATLTGLA